MTPEESKGPSPPVIRVSESDSHVYNFSFGLSLHFPVDPSLLRRPQVVQNAAAPLLSGKRLGDHTTPVLPPPHPPFTWAGTTIFILSCCCTHTLRSKRCGQHTGCFGTLQGVGLKPEVTELWLCAVCGVAFPSERPSSVWGF